jgi:hypothetical protein
MKTLTIAAKILLCLAWLPLPAKLGAATTSNGDFTVNPATGESGNLTVDGNLGVNGAVDFVNGFHFGSTLETTPASAVEFLYGENGTDYALALKTRRPNTAFLWQDNAAATLKTKMRLGADNALTLYKSNGDAGIVLDPGSTGVTFDGQALLTQSAAESLFMPASPSSFAVGEGTAATGLDSTATGYGTTASGDFSTATGDQTKAYAYASFALGRNNVGGFAAGGDTAWVETDPVLEIGNGGDWNSPSNAVTILKNANMRTGGKAEFKGGVRVPPQGDLSMGDFTAGNNPADLDPTLGLKYQNE